MLDCFLQIYQLAVVSLFPRFFKILGVKGEHHWVHPMQTVKHIIFREAFPIPSLMC